MTTNLTVQFTLSFGVRDKILQWIKDFLMNRTQQVVLNGQKCGSIPVTSSVPQGSVLGPLCSRCFVNDIAPIVSSSTFMFADDTKVFHFIRSSDY